MSSVDTSTSPRPTTPTERTPFEEQKPEHITYTGEENELARRTWKQIGSGIQDEEHARRVGRVIREEVEEVTAKKAKAIRSLEDDFEKAKKRIADEVEKHKDKSFKEQVEATAKLREQADDVYERLRKARVELNIERGEQSLRSLKKTRDFGGVNLEYRGNRKLRTALQQSEENIPKDWLRDSKEAGKIEVRKRARGYHRNSENAIAIPSEKSLDTATHELIHRMEYKAKPARGKPSIVRLEKEFKMRRAKGERATKIYADESEWGIKDDFTDHYMGKVYPNDRAHEIMTMGWEGVRHGAYDIWADPDYVDFVLGVLAGV